MVSKNNLAKKAEETANRQSRFGIRKLTIGAVSVLLGTTLWFGKNAGVVHAADVNDNADNSSADEAEQATTSTPRINSDTKVVVTTNNNVAQNNTKQVVKDTNNNPDSNKAPETNKLQNAGTLGNKDVKIAPNSQNGG